MKVNVVKGFRPNANDSESVSLRGVSVQVGLGVPLKLNVSMGFRLVKLFRQQTFDYPNNYYRV